MDRVKLTAPREAASHERVKFLEAMLSELHRM